MIQIVAPKKTVANRLYFNYLKKTIYQFLRNSSDIEYVMNEQTDKYMNYSVALCTYNGAKYVVEQLDSIVKQTVQPTQIIVSDDGSKDGTMEIVDNYLSDKGIRYIVCANQTNHGVTGNFMNAMKQCTEEVIFTSDQDDYWMPEKAEKMLAAYEQNPQAMMVFSNGELVDSNMKPLGCDIWKAVGITPQRCEEGNWFHYLIKNCLITGACMSIRRNLLDDIDDIPKEWLHDGWLTWAAVIRNGLVPYPEKLIKYRQHGNNVVGMKPVYAIFDRFKGWLANFDEIPEHRKIRYNRYYALQQKWGDRFTDAQQEELSDCIYFWKQLVDLSEKPFIKRPFIILSLYFRGNYNRFFVKTRGCLRDLYFIFK